MASSAVSDACQPSFSSLRETVKPSMPFSRTKKERPWCPPAGVVFTAVTTKSARTPLVMNVFEPLTIQPPSTRSAWLRSPATSEPASGSGMPSAPIFSPLIAGTSQRCFWSSVPNFKMGGGALFPWRRVGDFHVAADRGAAPARAAARELLGPDSVMQIAAALAAVLLFVLQAEE